MEITEWKKYLFFLIKLELVISILVKIIHMFRAFEKEWQSTFKYLNSWDLMILLYLAVTCVSFLCTCKEFTVMLPSGVKGKEVEKALPTLKMTFPRGRRTSSKIPQNVCYSCILTVLPGLRLPKELLIISFKICPSMSKFIFIKYFTMKSVHSVSQFKIFPCWNRTSSIKIVMYPSASAQVTSWPIKNTTRNLKCLI